MVRSGGAILKNIWMPGQYLEATHATLAYRTVYRYTDVLFVSVEQRDASGNVFSTVTYTYDADGNRTQLFDGVNRTTYRYNGEGRLVSSVQESRGGIPIVCTWDWTTTATGADYDEDCMGYRASGSVDTRGLETFRVVYDLTSGDPASETTKVWRTDCQPLSEATDRLLGGTDSSLAYAYDANGRQTGLVSESASGTFSATSSYTCPG
jgi:YD repeat-containing protein